MERETPTYNEAYKCLGIILLVILGIGILLMVILLPLSFSSLEYYEIGFPKRKSTGSVDTNEVFGPGGRHLIGPDYTYKTFPADGHFVEFINTNVFTADRLHCGLTVYFFYFLRPHQLSILHKHYDLNYAPILENNAKDALKGAATKFSNRNFTSERNVVATSLFKAIRERLSGKCCEKDCTKSGLYKCIDGCKKYDTCDESDFGLFVDVRYFQMGRVDLPDEINERNLRTITLKLENEREKFRQEAQIVRRGTDAEVAKYQNKAKEIKNHAYVERDLILSQAKANATATVENARSEGLKNLYDELNIKDIAKRSSFDYLRTLRGKSNVHLKVNFDKLIAGRQK